MVGRRGECGDLIEDDNDGNPRKEAEALKRRFGRLRERLGKCLTLDNRRIKGRHCSGNE